MTRFEWTYVLLEPFFLPVHRLVRRQLRRRVPRREPRFRLLDVGGRKSHYTTGVPADVVVTDLPRQTDIQERLHLGINDQIARQTLGRRSNIREVLLDDMTRSELPERSFDGVVSVEVLEHVEKDDDFVRHVARVLKPGGFFFMTTPNGDFVKNTNPDHKRHYSRAGLERLLAAHFPQVEVWYGVKDSAFRRWGLGSFSPRHPVAMLRTMAGNLLNFGESLSPRLATQASGTHHLFAVARTEQRP